MDKRQSIVLKQKLYKSVPQKYHNDLDSLYKQVDYQNFSPVKRFEEAVGIKGIYHQYNIPGSVSPEEYESYIKPIRVYEMIERNLAFSEDDPSYDNKLKVKGYLFDDYDLFLSEAYECYKELLAINPEIKNIKPYDKYEIRSYVAIISGVCSGFSPEDIAAFVAARNPSDNEALNNRRTEMSQEIEKITGKKGEEFINNEGKKINFPLINNWCPSEETYKRIQKEVLKKYSTPINSKSNDGR